jgi:flagellar biosynthesis chaperone FliJ
MKRVFAGALTLVLCCATWLAAADSEKKKPVSKQAATISAEQLQQIQTQLKQQQEQIEKLRAQLEQSRQALQQAQQKLQAGTEQTEQQAVAAHQKANSINDQLIGMQAAPSSAEQKPRAK